jgi:hypothetical protein
MRAISLSASLKIDGGTTASTWDSRENTLRRVDNRKGRTLEKSTLGDVVALTIRYRPYFWGKDNLIE